jgi:hypothetical protein
LRRVTRWSGLAALAGAGALYAGFILEGPLRGKASPADEADAVRMLEMPVRAGPGPVDREVRLPGEEDVLLEAARRAWAYWTAFHRPQTGLVASVAWYDYATVWDMGSTVAALHSARALGLVEAEDYRGMMLKLLQRIGGLEVIDGTSLNKFYKTDTGQPADREGAPSLTGFGWSAVDLGRLLVWLRIVSQEDPAFAAAAQLAVERLDLNRMTERGLIWGGASQSGGRWTRFAEGRLGYEQYASRGYELWGHGARQAAVPDGNTRSVEVLGIPLLTDSRPRSCLTSEPFLLWGIELGMPEWADSLSSRLLDVQEARYHGTGLLTLLSEDAVTVPPDFFYYSCVHDGTDSFVVLTPEYERAPEAPKTVSTKAAFGWYALRPTLYTSMALHKIMESAVLDDQWVAAVTEGSFEPIGAPNINTTAMILEAALYVRDGLPLLERARSAAEGSPGDSVAAVR